MRCPRPTAPRSTDPAMAPRSAFSGMLNDVRDAVATERRSILGGRDPARLTACNVALEALVRLWARS